MADLKNYKIEWKHAPRPWGNEIAFGATNLTSGRVFNEVIVFKSKPIEMEAYGAISARLDRCEQAIIDRDAERPVEINSITADQVEAYLKAEGVLKDTETIADLKITLSAVEEVGK